MIGKGLPDLAMVCLDQPAIAPRDAQRFQGNALGVEHAEDVMVGDDEQIGGRAEGCVFIGQQRGIDVAVRRDDGQACDALVELARHPALRGVGIEEPVCQKKLRCHGAILSQKGLHFDRGEMYLSAVTIMSVPASQDS